MALCNFGHFYIVNKISEKKKKKKKKKNVGARALERLKEFWKILLEL